MNNMKLFFLLGLTFCTATLSFASNSGESSISDSDDFEGESLSELVQSVDLDNFPDPFFLLPLAAMGIETEALFIEYWLKKTGFTIRKFSSFTRVNPNNS